MADTPSAGLVPFERRAIFSSTASAGISLPSEPLIDKREQLAPGSQTRAFALFPEPQYCPIQGPPGSGKTYTGARMVVELVKQGRRVGITAVSHKVISNLLQEICEAAQHSRRAAKSRAENKRGRWLPGPDG